MSDEQWGPGDLKGAKAFATAKMQNGEEFELFNGEHPHSRNSNNQYARFKDGRIEGFDGHRVIVKVELETYNYLKQSGLSGNEVRKGGTGKIFFDGAQVAEFFYRETEYGLRRAQKLIDQLFDHPGNIWDKKTDLKGRKVYYRDTPAVITHWFKDQGTVMVQACPGHLFPIPAYVQDDPDGNGVPFEEEERHRVKCELWDPHIWWFRKVNPPEPAKRKEPSPFPGMV